MFGRKKKEPGEKRFKTLRDAYSLAKEEYSFILLRCLAIFVPILILGIAIGALLGHPGYGGFVTAPFAFLGAFYFFTRLASNAAYTSIEGQPGAGASVLMAIRKGWTVTPATSVNRNQDIDRKSTV